MTMGNQVVAGPSNSVVIDKQGMYWMAGKVSRGFKHDFMYSINYQWKNSGDGTQIVISRS